MSLLAAGAILAAWSDPSESGHVIVVTSTTRPDVWTSPPRRQGWFGHECLTSGSSQACCPGCGATCRWALSYPALSSCCRGSG